MTTTSPKLSGEVTLVVRNLGHVPSKKNNKMVARGRLITAPKCQEWVKKCLASFISQLSSGTLTCGDATLTAHSLHSLMSSLPSDDNWTIIPQINVRAEKVAKGEEGADIAITPISV